MANPNPDLMDIYSPFPPLTLMENRTNGKSRGQFRITPDQVEGWPGFDTEVKAVTRGLLGPLPDNIRIGEADIFKVSTEAGVVGRYNHRVSEPVNKALRALPIGRLLGEYPRGDNRDIQCAKGKQTDFTIQDVQERVRVVGEAKTPWTTELGLELHGGDAYFDTCRVLGRQIF